MAELNAKKRDALPDSAFAYIDSKGGRHLPINDAAHVRAAMSRFNQTQFESPSAKSKAHAKIMAAAKKFGIDVSNFSDEPFTSEADVQFAAESDAESVTRVGKLFACGTYPDKDFEFDQADLQRAIAAFEPVPVDLEHVPSVLDGKLGFVQRVFAGEDGASLYGEVRLPKWLDAVLEDGERKVSATWDRATKTLKGLALVRTPRVSDAALMAAFSASLSQDTLDGTTFAERSRHPTGQYAREDSGDGQQAMQHIHDVAAAYGARQRRKTASTATMASTHEVRGFQSIHDTASTHGAAHGAACTPATMSDEPWNLPLVSWDTPATTTPIADIRKANDKSRSRKRMNLKELLTGMAADKGVEIDDLEASLTPPDTAKFDAKLAEKDAKIAALEAAQQQQAAQFARLAAERLHAEAAAFAQGLVQSHRVPPGAAESLTALAERVMASDSTATFAEGTKSTQALLAEFAAALPDYSVFTTSTIKSPEVAALFNTSTVTAPDGTDKDTIDKLLALTPDGKALLGERK